MTKYIDIDFLQSQFGGDSMDFLDQLFPLFVEQTEAQLNELGSAILDHDDPKIKTLSHSIKASAATVGATSFANVFAQLEQENDQNTKKRLFEETQAIFPKLKLELNAFILETNQVNE